MSQLVVVINDNKRQRIKPKRSKQSCVSQGLAKAHIRARVNISINVYASAALVDAGCESDTIRDRLAVL